VSQERFPARTGYQDKRTAAEYDEFRLRTWRRRLFHRMELRAIARAAATLPSDSRVLDMPCGTGRAIASLVTRCRSVVGADISGEMIEIARARFEGVPNIEWVQADALALPFADDEFDCVFSLRFFGHTPPDVRLAAMKEMARVTRDRVALMLYVRDPLITARKRLQRLLRRPPSPWYAIRSRRELAELFGEAGLAIRSIHGLMPAVMESRMVIATKGQ